MACPWPGITSPDSPAITGLLDSEGAAVLHAALDPLCAPDANALPRLVDPDGLPAIIDDRTPRQRRHDALIDLCRLALNTSQLPDSGGNRPQVTVTVGYDPLTKALGVGMFDTGIPLSPEMARRLACDAHILPAVLDTNSVPLDLGRERRLWTGAARTAILLRDRGCSFPACDRPARWCHIHHIRPWTDGGPTNQTNGTAMCGHHHHVIHHSDWTVHITPDGLPTYTPPHHIDPQQRPRRNTYHPRP